MKIYKIILFAIIIFINNSYAVNEIEISSGVLDPIPVALTEFKTVTPNTAYLAEEIRKVVHNDLKNSGLFKMVSKDAFLEEVNGIDYQPNFSSWHQIGVVALTATDLNFDGENYVIEYKLWDIFRQKIIDHHNISFKSDNSWRIAAHKLSDKIYERLTGDKGYFNSKIAFVSESGPANQRVKRLSMMDQDCHNPVYLTSGKHLVLTPRFSPDGKKIVYLSYANRIPRVYVFDLISKEEFVVGDFPGMTYAPSFSPDGKEIVLSATHNGNSSIYIVDLSKINKNSQQAFKSLPKKRITFSKAIDTTPSFSPDGKNIVFVSDRGGSPQLYVMNRDGNNVRRISFGEGRYAAPSWSPRGDLIAFTKVIPGQGFHIGIMRTDGTGERTITKGYLVESQSWSPNGRVLVYARSEPTYELKYERTRLRTIDITGYNDKELETPMDASDPNWSVSFY